MPRPEKVQAVEDIREQFDEARATFVTEYRGLTVGEQQQLRRSIKTAQGEYRVLKMSLARRAVEDMSLEGLTDLLAGPTALAFAHDDPVPVAKALRDFASDHDRLIIKGGILGGAMLPPEQISRLADIESREVLLAKIAGGIKAPWSKMAGMLGAKVRDAASMLSQLLEKKEEQEPASDEVAAEQVTEEAAAEPAEAGEASEARVEETPEAEAAPEAEAEAAPEAEVEEAPETEAEEAPAEVIEEASAADVDDTPEAEAEEAPEVEAEKAPTADAEEAPAAEAEVEEPQAEEAEEPKAAEPAPKKRAAPKAKAKKSTAKADASPDEEVDDETAADDSNDTAEEE